MAGSTPNAAQELFERAQRFEKEDRLEEAIDAYRRVVPLAWRTVTLYERLLDLHLHRRELDAAWCVASMLVAFEDFDVVIADNARELFEDYVPRRLLPCGKLDPSDWALLRDEGEDHGPPTAERPSVSAPPIEKTVGYDSAALEWAVDVLGVSANIEVTDPPLEPKSSLDATHRMFLLRERLFFAGREATSYVAPYFDLRRCPAHVLRAKFPAFDDGRWQRAMNSTRTRAGVLVCREPLVAFQRLVLECAPEEELCDLAAFTVSAAHQRLRAKLGITVGTNADRP